MSEKTYPTSFGQEQTWFVARFHDDMPMHNVPLVMRLTGPLDRVALRTALDALVARHGALRTRIVSGADGRPSQAVDEPSSAAFAERDLSDLAAAAARPASPAELTAAEAFREFALDEGPLFRALLVRLTPDDHVLLAVAHAIVFDRGSAGVLLTDLAALYEMATAGDRAPVMAAPPLQMVNHALGERDRLRGAALGELTGYWRTALAGFSNLQLPTDHPRPIMADHKGGVERLNLGAAAPAALTELARRAGTTPFTVLLAMIAALLHRYTGQDDFVLGAAHANRDRPGSARSIGAFADLLPIRTDLSGGPTFAELLGRVRDTLAAAHAHGDLPFAKLLDELAVVRDTGRPPVFQVALSLDEFPDQVVAAGVAIRLDEIILPASRYDLDLFASVRSGELWVAASYATALFDAATVRRLLGHLRVLLAGAAADPGRRVPALPVLSDEELHRELVEWNDTAAALPVMCIHEGFERQVGRTPDAIAAELGDEEITYAGLNADANRIARWLRGLGVGPEVLVGIKMAPSPRRLAAVLGIMKAGGGYVPLDPALPPDRLAFMAADAAMPTIISDKTLDQEWAAITSLDDSDPGFSVRPSNVAYVIYTSGSTGRPKGVVVEHRHAVNFLMGMIPRWEIGPADRLLQFASLSFDVSVAEMFMALLSGARAVLAPPETLSSPPRLADLIRDRAVTFASMPPAVVSLLTGEELPTLRVLISSGEELPAELVRRWLRPGLHFYNGYGPTEAAIGTAFSEIDETMIPPPIGRPKHNYQAYVLDGYLNPVPVGVAGELHVGGAGVTRGYLNAPAFTAQRFIADPFRPGARLYKTGDLVRRLPDGNLVFVGRIDGQVKIRGLRVELGEIETALVAHPAVAQAVVVLNEDRAGQKQLVGYVRPDAGGVSIPELRQHLAVRLPAYMVPPHLLVLESFPLTPNRKIDKAALPAPPAAVQLATYEAPRTLVEVVLTDSYARLLGHDRVGVDDGFFDLGGNSLQAMQLITGLRGDLAVDLGVAAVFRAPTPRQLAVLLRYEHGLDDAEWSE